MILNMLFKPIPSNSEFDFDNMPPGNYTFSGEEGVIHLYVDENSEQHWNFENWFSTLDPDSYLDPSVEDIAIIKKRIDPLTGNIRSIQKKKKNRFLELFTRQ